MKEGKDDKKSWTDMPYLWTGTFNIVNRPPKAIYSAISVKLPMALFTELEQKNLKICMKSQKTQNSQGNLKEEKWS